MNKICVSCFLLFLSACSGKKEASEGVYSTTPINPLYLSSMFFEENKVVNIKDRTGNLKKEFKLIYDTSGVNTDNKIEGYYENIRDKYRDGISYEYLGKWEEYDVFYTYQWSPGTGRYANIGLYKLAGDRIEYRMIDGGDRANGAILSHPIMDNGKIYYYRHLNIETLLEVANIKIPKDIKIRSSCCVCYAAIGKFSYDLKLNKRKVLGINFSTPYFSNPVNGISKYEQIIIKMINNGKIFLDEKSTLELFNNLRNCYRDGSCTKCSD